MLLVFVRHGKAEEKKPGLPDEERALTREGAADVEAVAKLLPVKLSVIYTSPLRRALQTAEVLSRVHGAGVKVSAELHPAVLSLNALAKLVLQDSAALVGHAPSIEKVVSELIGGGNVKIGAGAAVGVEVLKVEKGGGVLEFLITPKIAREALKVSEGPTQ